MLYDWCALPNLALHSHCMIQYVLYTYYVFVSLCFDQATVMFWHTALSKQNLFSFRLNLSHTKYLYFMCLA